MNIFPYESIIIIIPLICACITIWRKVSIKHYVEAGILGVITFFIICDGFAAVAQLHENEVVIPRWIDMIQLYSGLLLLPLAYTYFAIQVGSGWKNRAIYECLITCIIVFFPNITIFLGEPSLGEDVTIRMNRFHIIKNGALIYIADLSDVVVMIQSIIILVRILVFNKQIKKLELTFSKEIKVFFLIAIGCIAFAFATYMIPWSFWIANKYLFVGGFALFTSMEYIQIAKNRDLSALVTKDTAEPVRLNEFIKVNNDLAQRARVILETEKRYLLPGLVIDDMVNELGTNRTYFTRMMRIEFGQSFNEYVNNQRLKYAQELLKTTDKGITEIAEESGFGSASAFCRVFKRLTETTPEAWRSTHQN